MKTFRTCARPSSFRKAVLTASFAAFGLALLAGCKKNEPAPVVSGVDPNDPAAANMAAAPAGQPYNGNAPAYNTQPSRVLGQNQAYNGNAQGTEYPPDSQYDNGSYEDQGNPRAYDTAYADQAPPPLPPYAPQPPARRPNSIWTPGYWAHSPRGYYWVPGAWVAAPYQGALWTPGYWQNNSGRYLFHPGYWGRHVGFYGGIPYGYGYPGRGFDGGYWNGPNFYYNTDVENVDPNVIRFVYVHPEPPLPSVRISFNGPGGISLLPIAAELIAMHERHRHPVRMQYESLWRYAEDPRQFYGYAPAPATWAVPEVYEPERWYGPAPQPYVVEQPPVVIARHHDNGNHYGEYKKLGIDAPPHMGKPEVIMPGAPEWHGDGPGEWHGNGHGHGDEGDGEGHGHGNGHGNGNGHGHGHGHD